MPKIDDTDTPKQPKSSDTMSDEALERAVAEYYSNDALAVVLPIRGDLVYGDGWKGGLRYTKKGGALTKDPGNAALILANADEWAGLRYDEFSWKVVCSNPPPLTGMSLPSSDPEALEVYVGHWLAVRWQQSFSSQAIRSAITYAARQKSFHQVRDYLNGLEWDGVERISTWVSTYLGAKDEPVTRAVGRMWLISAVARAYVPGAKVDHMLVLEGLQGTRKTTALEALCSAEWYQPELGDLRHKDSISALRGKWVVCMDELHALRTVDLTELAKNYLTRTVDKFRPVYGRDDIEQPRGCVFAGTTNADSYLNDPTGNRRFWPVNVGIEKPIDIEAIKRDRNQLWAEARDAYRAGEHWWPDRQLGEQLQEVTALRREGDPWDAKVEKFLDGLEWTTMPDILGHLGIEPGKQEQRHQNRVAKILTRVGWAKRQVRVGNRRERRYYSPTCDTSDTL